MEMILDILELAIITVIGAFVMMAGIVVAMAVLGIVIPTFGKLFMLSLITYIVTAMINLVVKILSVIAGDD